MSGASQHLSRPPITEAVLDLRVSLPSDRELAEIIRAFTAAVAAEYPEQRPIRRLQAHFAVPEGGDGEVTSGQLQVGCIWWTSDRKRAVQARQDGFSVNHVGDYKDWEAIIGDAQRLWPAYLAAARPDRVLRCAARFINRIEIPAGDELKKHLQTFPEVGGSLPAVLEEYSFRCVLPFGDGRRAAITQATLPWEGAMIPSSRPMLLDIDASSEREFAPDSPDLWAEFSHLRRIKNECFFGSLHSTTWRGYV